MPLFDYACMARAYKVARITFPISLLIYAAALASDPATDKRDVMRFFAYVMTCMLLYMMPPAERNAAAGGAGHDQQGQPRRQFGAPR